MPSAERFRELIYSPAYWVASDLENRISSSGLVDENFSIKGILNLLEDLGIECGFEIYTPELDRTTRNSLDLYEKNFVIQTSSLKKVNSLLKKAKGLPGRCGIANLTYLKYELSGYYDLIADLVRNSSTS